MQSRAMPQWREVCMEEAVPGEEALDEVVLSRVGVVAAV